MDGMFFSLMSLPVFFKGTVSVFLVPKPLLGNAIAGEAPASRDGRRTEAGASGADAFPSWGLGTRKGGILISLNLKIRISYQQKFSF
jgi:hypothetical protein